MGLVSYPWTSPYKYFDIGDHLISLTGDFDGDLKPELLVVLRSQVGPGSPIPSSEAVIVHLDDGTVNTVSGFFTDRIANSTLGVTGFPEQQYLLNAEVLDFDGNGKDDIYISLTGGDAEIKQLGFLNNGTINSLEIWHGTVSMEAGNTKLADFNMDGKTDILKITESSEGDSFQVFYSTGISTIPGPVTQIDFSNNPSGVMHYDKAAVVDMNGDGFTDIIFGYMPNSASTTSHIDPLRRMYEATFRYDLYINEKNSFSIRSHAFALNTVLKECDGTDIDWAERYLYPPVKDYNNDGILEIAFNGDPFSIKDQKHVYFPKGYGKLSNVIDGLGNSVSVMYSKVHDFLPQPIYKDLKEYPVQEPNFIGPNNSKLYTGDQGRVKVRWNRVSEIVRCKGVTKTKTIYRNFQPMVLSSYGLLGYGYTEAYVYAKHIDDTGYLLIGTKVEVKEPSSIGPFMQKKAEYEYRVNHQLPGYPKDRYEIKTRVDSFSYQTTFLNGVYHTYKTVSRKSNMLTGQAETIRKGQDNFGNITQFEKFFHTWSAPWTAVGVDSEITSYTYHPSTGKWIPSDVATKDHFSQVVNSPNLGKPPVSALFSTKTTYEYHTASNGFALKSIREHRTRPYGILTEYLNIDDFGNARTIKETPYQDPNGQVRTTTRIFDAFGRNMLSSTNPQNLTEAYNYNAKGDLLSITYPSSFQKTYKYNDFRRVTETESHLLKVTSSLSFLGNLTGAPSGTVYYSIENHDTKGLVTTFFDGAGRELKKEWKDGLNETVYTNVYYDREGRITQTNNPKKASENYLNYTKNIYDHFGRVVKKEIRGQGNPQEIVFTFYPKQNKQDIIDRDGLKTTKNFNARGRLISVTDPFSTLNYNYHPSGEIISVESGGITLQSKSYDSNTGWLILKTDNNTTGIESFEYNAFGQIIRHTDANANVSLYDYNSSGQIIKETRPEGAITYTYFTSGVANGKLKTLSMGPYSIEYEYNSLGLLSKEKRTFNGVLKEKSFGYDAFGQLTQYTFPSGLSIKYEYTNGVNTKITDASNKAYYELINVRGDGKILSSSTYDGGGKTYDYDYHLPHYLKEISHPAITQEFKFDPLSGNLLERSVNSINHTRLTEYFTYDKNRLTGISTGQSVPPHLEITYDGNGNILTKTDAGNYGYNPLSNQVSSIELDGSSQIPNPTQEIYYNSLNKLTQIKEDSFTHDFTYGPDKMRWTSRITDPQSNIIDRLYFGDYEEETTGGVTKKYHYIHGPMGAEAVVIIEGSNSPVTYTTIVDHLGSILGLISEVGALVEERNFDAWGRERNPNTWASYQLGNSPSFILFRGYTSHEELKAFNLIHMNGRLYDPVVGRMLSKDPVVQAPDFSQSYNGYSYVWNNPLKYNDPSGYVGNAGYHDDAINGDPSETPTVNNFDPMGNVYRSKGHEETIRMLDQWEWEAKVRKELERVFAQEEADDNELQGVWTPEQLFNEFGYSFSQNFLHGLIDLVNSSSINDLEDKIPNYVIALILIV
mgnify:FL=1